MMAIVLVLLAGALALAPIHQRSGARLQSMCRIGEDAPRSADADRPTGRANDGRRPPAVPGALTRWRITRRGGVDLRVAVRALAEDLESGASPADAWGRAADLAGSAASFFRRVAAALRAGRSLGDAIGAAPDRELHRLASVWECSAESGAASAEVLRRWIEDADARERARRALAVELAGPRASAVMLAALPVLGLALGVAMGAEPIGALTESLGGAALALTGVALDAAGVIWMLRILAAAARQ